MFCIHLKAKSAITLKNKIPVRKIKLAAVFHLALSNMAQRHVAFCERHVALHERHVALLECHVAVHVRHVAHSILGQ